MMRKLLFLVALAVVTLPLLVVSRSVGSFFWYGTVNFVAGGLAGLILNGGDA